MVDPRKRKVMHPCVPLTKTKCSASPSLTQGAGEDESNTLDGSYLTKSLA